ncbi:MAG: NUDIX hydrolase [bacterium]
MKITKKEIAFQGEYLKVKRSHFEAKNGTKGVWEHTEKTPIPFVVVFALTKDKEVILERNWRIPSEDWVLELPSGLNDEEGESEAQAAKRELLEETGYRAEKVIPVFRCLYNPAGTKEEASYYFAPDVVFAGPSKGDGVEEIEILKVPLAELVEFIYEESKTAKVCERILAVIPILQLKGLI